MSRRHRIGNPSVIASVLKDDIQEFKAGIERLRHCRSAGEAVLTEASALCGSYPKLFLVFLAVISNWMISTAVDRFPRDGVRGTESWRHIHDMAQLSLAAYESTPSTRNDSLPDGWTMIHDYDDGRGTFIAAAYSERSSFFGLRKTRTPTSAVLVYRGTADLGDVSAATNNRPFSKFLEPMLNLYYLAMAAVGDEPWEKLGNGIAAVGQELDPEAAHMGEKASATFVENGFAFASGYQMYASETHLNDLVSKCPRETCARYITGHSMGGAIAEIAAVRLCKLNGTSEACQNPDDPLSTPGLFTFGAPPGLRSLQPPTEANGNSTALKEILDNLSKRAKRIVTHGDHVPDLWLGRGIGEREYIEPSRSSRSLPDIFFRRSLDHGMAAYLEDIEYAQTIESRSMIEKGVGFLLYLPLLIATKIFWLVVCVIFLPLSILYEAVSAIAALM